jgi:hypothetical protein
MEWLFQYDPDNDEDASDQFGHIQRHDAPRKSARKKAPKTVSDNSSPVRKNAGLSKGKVQNLRASNEAPECRS